MYGSTSLKEWFRFGPWSGQKTLGPWKAAFSCFAPDPSLGLRGPTACCYSGRFEAKRAGPHSEAAAGPNPRGVMLQEADTGEGLWAGSWSPSNNSSRVQTNGVLMSQPPTPNPTGSSCSRNSNNGLKETKTRLQSWLKAEQELHT